VPPIPLPESYLLFVGTRGGYKNFLLFVEAVGPLLRKDHRLHVVCVGGGGFTPSEADGLSRQGILERCHQHQVRDEHLAHYYEHARAFVFPSTYEGFGIPIVEAFSCGCPAAVSDASCFPEIASSAALYFDPDDPESMRSAVERLMYDDALRTRLAAEGRMRAQEFRWERTAAQTLAVYRALAP
jgi:glycosyltransferase involved in cell wall biosynthesis